MTDTMTEPNYYPKGGCVFKRPIGGQMGFLVCECSEDVEGAAEAIADALNQADAKEAAEDIKTEE